jgi:rhodanese-related sulfurtransferase
MTAREIDAAGLKRWIDEGRAFILLDVLPGAAYEETHLPGARNACVYEVNFLDQVAKTEARPDGDVVVYCSSPASRASADAVERLAAAGYTKLRRFAGGRSAWQEAGHPFEGSSADRPWEPRPVRALREGEYALDTDKSELEWVGRNVAGRHAGTLRFASGTVRVEGGRLVGGSCEVDMGAITVTDLTGELATVLKQHLEHEDFFAVERFPTARFEVTGAAAIEGATPGAVNYEIAGRLNVRGVDADVAFGAVVAPHGEDALALQGHFDLDRTRWSVNYGSGKLYERLGMHLVNDEVSLQVRLIAR